MRCSRGEGASKDREGKNKQEHRIKSERPEQGAGAAFLVWEKGYRVYLCPYHTLREKWRLGWDLEPGAVRPVKWL